VKFPEIFPPSDLLKQVEGIESGLRQRQRLGIIGVLATLVQAILLVRNHEWFDKLVNTNWREWPAFFTGHWLPFLILAGVISSLLLAGWAKFWIKESQEPFRYTYSIADFKPVLGDKAEGPKEDRLSFQLSHDLAGRLNDRIKRLSLLDEQPEIKAEQAKDEGHTQPKLEPTKRKSHIHIRGYYVIRQKPDDQWFVEVMPRVRIGPKGSTETLAHPVKFRLPKNEEDPKLGAKEKQATAKDKEGVPAATTLNTGPAPPTMTARQYEQILERVYFSVATEIYKQIQQDVKRKLELLPTDYFRAVALFHEAEDYANSNTLDAYEAARKLYDQALYYFDPDWKSLSKFPPWKLLQRIYRILIKSWISVKRGASAVWPRLGRVEVMCARAEIGYADMLLYRRILAGLSGQRSNTSFEAPRVAERAVNRLQGLSEDVKERKQAIFDAYVTLALGWHYLGSSRAAEKKLGEARGLDPVRAETNARYLFVYGEVEPHIRSKLNLFRSAIEVDSRFEAAHFSLASQVEMLWRMRPSFERNVAELVFKEYEEVLSLNPGNIGSWANQGYIQWLLATNEADLQSAREAFEYGREYKEIKSETFVAELDYGLARIAAERGDFANAYSHYTSAVSAHLAQGMNFGVGTNLYYFFQLMNRSLLQRFIDYKEEVERNFKLWAAHREGKWQSRSFQEVIKDLSDGEKENAARKGIANLFECISPHLTPADGERLEKAIGERNLRAMLDELKSSSPKAIQRKLRSPDLAEVVNKYMQKYMPTQRVNNSVYSFVLNEYGQACYHYYLRSASHAWLETARAAYEEAITLNREYVMPRYHLYEMESWANQLPKAEHWMGQIVSIEPDWPDAILALALVRAKLAKEHSKEAERLVKKAEGLRAEAKELEKKSKAASALKSGIGRQSAIDAKEQEANREEKRADEHKQRKRDLARSAVDGIRKLLPFKWAEGALDEELRQSTMSHEEGPRSLAMRMIAALGIRWLLELANRAAFDSAGREISALLGSKDIKWEKELADIHVKALSAWGAIRSLLSDRAVARRLTGRIELPGEDLLCHIRRHFWPDEFDLHFTLRSFSKPVFGWEAIPGADEKDLKPLQLTPRSFWKRVFAWEAVPRGRDDENLKAYLSYLLGANWVRKAVIKKASDQAPIQSSKGNRIIKLQLDQEQGRAILILPGIDVIKENNELYLHFSDRERVAWNNIPGSDNARLLALLRRSLGISRWLKKAALAKSEDDSTITLSAGEHSLSLKVEGTTLIAHEFKVEKSEDGKHDIQDLEYENTSNEVLRDAIVRGWHGDQTSYAILSWVAYELLEKAIDEEERRKLFAPASEEDNLPPSLYKWLGDQWFNLAARALDEFGQAVRANDKSRADSALEKATQEIDQALLVYRKAMEVENGD
jgi:hypothetical protein